MLWIWYTVYGVNPSLRIHVYFHNWFMLSTNKILRKSILWNQILAKSHFGISSNRKIHQHNTILSIQEFIIMRTNPLTDHCAKQREAHTSFSCYWPLQKSPISIFIQPLIAKCFYFDSSQCFSEIVSIIWQPYSAHHTTNKYPIGYFWPFCCSL